ncbi:outer membrane lipopolysaccharide assembly protein LptE/RlpB [Rhabdobacter roseus]|uniref:Outer membrane lipopolysaccharide assembly protein LptE/RlpB n=1 Tax=Rhabdobacter roseus TaxID=1655419 RepID=A0A840TQH5_9BACT|nr:hypothetical protein [Rhabdobacter roseus]MBB5282300.1 outer membrane lipopolysaccharide assembly protein LptE/RlpB [Rhabdobacter roseus]
MLSHNRLKHATLWGVLLLLSACGREAEQTKALPDAPIYTLVFLDKTQSVNVNKNFVNEKYRQALTEIVEQNMRNKGDKLEVYFIHENTSKARALSLTVRSEKEGIEYANATDREAIETNFQLALQREKGIFLRQALTKLNQQNTGGSNQWTDVWGSLPVIAKAAESGAEVRVYYFSDMIESMRGADRRDFHQSPPITDAVAEQYAQADAKKLEQNAIGSPQVTIVSPFEPTASTKENNPHVAHYWQILFQELGGVSVEEL